VLGLDIAYRCTTFDSSSFSRSRDMIGAHQNSNGLRDLTKPLSGVVCHPWAVTCYDKPTHQLPNLMTLSPVSTYDENMKGDTEC